MRLAGLTGIAAAAALPLAAAPAAATVAAAAIPTAAAVAAPSAVPWNPRAPENNQLLPAFELANVESVLASIRATSQSSGKDPARPLIVATFPNGKRALISFLSCAPGGNACKALGIQASWNPPPGAAPAALASAVEAFNQRYSFSKAYVTSAGRPALQRYLTADYGFVRGNLAVNLLVFADQEERFMAEVLRPLVK